MANLKLCDFCKKSERQSHFNSKYCLPCKKFIRSKWGSIASISSHNEKIILENAGSLSTTEISQITGLSRATVMRFLSQNKISARFEKYDTSIKNKVIKYYERHGLQKTKEKFPGITVRSIVERNNHEYRQIKWKSDEMLFSIKSAGILPHSEQAKILSRPNAYSGSIKSLWQKRLKAEPTYVNGMPYGLAKKIVDPKCPVYWRPVFQKDCSKAYAIKNSRRFVLWIDIERHMRNDVDKNIGVCIKAMAKFQRLIHANRVRHNITKYLRKYYGKSYPKGGAKI